MAHHLVTDVVFSENSHPRTPCVLVIDCSDTMSDVAIHNINQGLKLFEEKLKSHLATSLGVQLLVIKVGGNSEPKVISEWSDAIDFVSTPVKTEGASPFLGRGINIALDEIEEQQQNYDINGVNSTSPWIIVLSASKPCDWGWEDVAERCKYEELQKDLVIFPVGTESADFSSLNEFSRNKALKINDDNFINLFDWLGRCMVSISNTKGDTPRSTPFKDWVEQEA